MINYRIGKYKIKFCFACMFVIFWCGKSFLVFMLLIRWTGQQELHHNAGGSIPSPRSLYAHI